MNLDLLPQGVSQGQYSLNYGHPDPATLPAKELEDAAKTVLGGPGAEAALQYGPEQGPPSLVDLLVEKHNREEGLAINANNVMVVAGSTHAVDMIARLLVGPGQGVLVEAPSYKDAIHIFQDHRHDIHGVAMDEGGVIVEKLEARLKELHEAGSPPAVFYTIPNFHNPTGTTSDESRRQAIVEFAERYDFIIVADDVYRDVAFEGSPPVSFFQLSGGQHVIRIQSFSKILSPGLRLGWVLGSHEHIERFASAGTTIMGGGANPFVAHVVAEYLRSRKLDAHLAKIRQVYRHKRDVVLAALEQHMPQDVTWTHPAGGYFIWLTLPESVDVTELEEVVGKQGVSFSNGTGFFLEPEDGRRRLRIAFSFASPNQLEDGIRIMAECVGELAA